MSSGIEESVEYGSVAREHGMKCPQCGDDTQITVACLLWVHLLEDGADTLSQDNEWDDSSPCKCEKCEHTATVKEFTIESPEDTDQ